MSRTIAILLQNLDLPAFNDDVMFEHFVAHYFNELENCNSYKRFGRLGQNQHGLDVYSNDKKTVIQCKVKTKFGRNPNSIRKKLIEELNSDLKKFTVYNNVNNLSYNRFIFASTFASDTLLSTECSKLSNNNITVEYWSWDDFKNQMPNKTFESYFNQLIPFLSNNISSETFDLDNGNKFVFDKTTPLINQLFDYFKHLYNEINVLPIHLLVNNYPFKKSEDFYVYCSQNTLTTDNDELFDFFESIKIENGSVTIKNNKFKIGVIDSSKKIKYILEKLTGHLIFNIKHKKFNKTINIRYSHLASCNCTRCSFGRLNYEDTFNGLLKKPKKIEEKLLLAYMHYDLGNFIESAKLFMDISKEAKKNKQLIRYAISQFNLSKLYIFIKNNYWEENYETELIEELKGIETDNLYCNSKIDEHKKLLEWILKTKFYTSKREDIYSTVNKIKDHYHTQLKGGWSSNSHIWSLINDYAEIEIFLKGNFIIYDRFVEYKELTDNFIEGLIISYALDESQESRLTHFDDWLFLRIVYNGNADSVLKLFNRYELKSIKYKPTSKKGDTFFDLVNNHLTKYQNISSAYEKSCEKSNRIFWEKYNSIFCNLMLLLSITEIEPSKVKTISNKLLKYLSETNLINHNSIKYVCLFINRQGAFTDKTDLYGFLNLFITNYKFHRNDFIEAVITQIKKNHKELVIDKKILNELFFIAFENCKLCSHKHSPEYIALVYDASQPEIREEIKYRIDLELKKEFNINLYYMSAIFNVYNGDDEFFDIFIQLARPKPRETNVKSFFNSSSKNRLSNVNMLLNLCFKNGIDLSQNKFDDFRNIDDYYSWLFNMDKFDYNKFNPKWATEYQTKFYIEQFKKHPIIKQKALEYLEQNSDYLVEKLILKLS